MKQMHKVQREILRQLLFVDKARYLQLKQEGMENSQFDYHLDKLIQDNYVEKKLDIYALTDYGKDFANRLDDSNAIIKLQPKTTTVICCRRKSLEGFEYLLYLRKKHPFYGCQGFPTHKVWIGQSIAEAACAGLREECGLLGSALLFAIHHYRIYSTDHVLMEDKIMFAHLIENPTGELISSLEGEYQWVPEQFVSEFVTNPLEEFGEIYNDLLVFSGKVVFKELERTTKRY